jgi:hypothetical protein
VEFAIEGVAIHARAPVEKLFIFISKNFNKIKSIALLQYKNKKRFDISVK